VQHDAVQKAAQPDAEQHPGADHLDVPRHFSLVRQFLQKKRAGPFRERPAAGARQPYFAEPELPLLLGELLLDPLLLGELLLGELLLEPLLLEPLLLGEELDPLLLGEELEPLLLGELDELPPVAPLLEPDLKCASHSALDTCPSLFLSTVENWGVELDAPLELLPPLDMPLDELPLELGLDELPLELGLDELPLELGLDELPLELGLDELPPLEELLPVALGDDLSLLELEEPELCAMDTLASANSAAAVAVVISFNFMW
jgi:hypothetical protein